MDIKNLIIIGAGPAGLTAGIYAARAQLNPLIIEGPKPGGQLTGTSYVENWPGNKQILGMQLMMNMKEQAQALGCTFLASNVTKIKSNVYPFEVETRNGTFFTKAIILATGATSKKLNCPGEEEYWGKGVTTCAVCDGALYKNKSVVIIGGGDTSMEEASFMTKFTNDITIIQLGDTLTASKAMQNRVLNNPTIKIIYNSIVQEIVGSNSHVTGLTIKNSVTNEITSLKAEGIFIAIGMLPQTDFLNKEVELDSYGYVKTTDNTKTSVEGIFAAGDVADYKYRQAITSAGAGCMAALDAERYLAHKKNCESL